MKQVILSMAVVMVAAGILVGTVLYTVAVLRDMQMRILTGELTSVTQVNHD